METRAEMYTATSSARSEGNQKQRDGRKREWMRVRKGRLYELGTTRLTTNCHLARNADKDTAGDLEREARVVQRCIPKKNTAGTCFRPVSVVQSGGEGEGTRMGPEMKITIAAEAAGTSCIGPES